MPAFRLEDPLQALCTAGRYRRCSLAAATTHLRKEPIMATSRFEQVIHRANSPAPDTGTALGPQGRATAASILPGNPCSG